MARAVRAAASGLVSLLTDFGTSDGYVAAMKGVILRLNPAAVLVDVTHEIAPQDVRSAAFVLHTAHRYFPPGTVHLAVVDPEVGTGRAGVILDTGEARFVGPDNGLFSYLLPEGLARHRDQRRLATAALSVPVPPDWRAVRIAESRYWLPNPSHTFHGRDIFAPVAAHLSMGEPVEQFGPKLELLRTLEIPVVRRLPGGGVEGAVLHVDRFGNLITNLQAGELPTGPVVAEAGGHRIERVSRTYAEAEGLAMLTGSSGYLEIAFPGGSAREVTGLSVGAPVRVLRAGTRGRRDAETRGAG